MNSYLVVGKNPSRNDHDDLGLPWIGSFIYGIFYKPILIHSETYKYATILTVPVLSLLSEDSKLLQGAPPEFSFATLLVCFIELLGDMGFRPRNFIACTDKYLRN